MCNSRRRMPGPRAIGVADFELLFKLHAYGFTALEGGFGNQMIYCIYGIHGSELISIGAVKCIDPCFYDFLWPHAYDDVNWSFPMSINR